MKIGIDMLRFETSYSGGVSTFAIGIINGLIGTCNNDDEIIILVSASNEDALRKVINNSSVSFQQIRISKSRHFILSALKYISWLLKSFKLILFFEKFLKSKDISNIENNLDVLFSPMTTLNFFSLSIPTLLSIHDIQQEYYPEFFSLRERASRWVSYRISSWAATSIQVSSRFISDCLIEKYPFVKSDKIFLAYEGVDFDKFNSKTEIGSQVLDQRIIKNNFLLYPAQIWKHKNHKVLIQALVKFRDLNGYEYPCVLTGQDCGYWDSIEREINNSNLNKVIYLGRVDFNKLLWLYQNCSAVLALGVHESSSLPIREGAVFGKPIICSDIPPNLEIKHLLNLNLISSNDSDLLAYLINKVESNDSILMNAANENIESVRLFNWTIIANDYWNLFHKWKKN